MSEFPWWMTLGVWLVILLGVPVLLLPFWLRTLTMPDLKWVRVRQFLYSLCVWYVSMVLLVFLGGNTWLGWMLSILYLIGALTWVAVVNERSKKPGPHPPAHTYTPSVGSLGEMQDELRQRVARLRA